MQCKGASRRSISARTLRGRLGLALLVASACSDPRFPADDASADDPSADGGPPLSAEQAPWVGRYAARSFLYATNGVLRPSATALWLITIKPRAEQLVMQARPCLFDGGWTLLLEGYLHYVYPDSSTPAEMALTFDADSFSSEQGAYTLGYTPQVPAGCDAAGDSIPAGPERPWLSGQCKCPSGDPSEVPTSPDDCRVTDGDDDGKPGVTFELVLSGARSFYTGAQRSYLRFSHGYRGRYGLYADTDTLSVTPVFSCTNGLTPDCSIDEATRCPAKYNKTEFVSVHDDYDCKRVIAEQQGLFPDSMPPFPSACAAEQ